MSNSSGTWVARLLTAVQTNSASQPGTAMFCQLSTVGLDGSPRCRTVVARKIEDSAGRLLICTSTGSDKWAELKRDSRFEICWYFLSTREQFRLRGHVTEFLLQQQQDKEAQEIWDDMTDSAKAMFTTVGSPSYDKFGVLALTPQTVKLLELSSGATTEWTS